MSARARARGAAASCRCFLHSTHAVNRSLHAAGPARRRCIDDTNAHRCTVALVAPCVACCRWGYASVGVLAEVLANYSAAGLPLETLWSDIDYQANRFRSMEFDAGAAR